MRTKRFMQKLIDGSSNLPDKCKGKKVQVNTMSAPFKQMENIANFCKAAEAYGVPELDTFQSVDLFEGRNMAGVLFTLLKLGTEAQRNGFNGMTIGTKPTEKNVREFTDEQLRAGEGMLGGQAGYTKGASQSGMSMGGARHVADIKVEKMSKKGEGVLSLQSGTNKGASQKGMAMGTVRHIADIKVDSMSKDSEGTIGLQAGSNKGASQAGMNIGKGRKITD